MALTAIAATAVAAEIEFLPYTEVMMIHTSYYLFFCITRSSSPLLWSSSSFYLTFPTFLRLFCIEDYRYLAEM